MTVRRWEWGVQTPNTDIMPRLAEALDTSVGYFMGFDNNTNTHTPTPDLAFSVPINKINVQSQTKIEDKGMLTYELGNGQKLQVPATPEYAPQFWARVDRLIGLQPAASPA